jgi:hypothetical protein
MYHDYQFKLSGKITFDPIDLTKKHVKQSEWKNTAIVLIDNLDFCRYYCWFIKKRYNLELQMPQRGLHFTVINDKVSNKRNYQIAKEKYDGTIVNLEYAVDPRTDGKHWWVGVRSEDAQAIRVACDLEPKPFWGLHLTIGRADGDLRLEHSNYIHHLIKKFGKEYN